MINKKTLLSIGSGLTVLTGLIAFINMASAQQGKGLLSDLKEALAVSEEEKSSKFVS